MLWLGALLAITLILVILVDAFEVMILPRRVRHGWRLARLYYRSTWIVWRGAARLFPVGRWRLGFLSVFGPLSLFGLLAVWAMGLIFSFALLHWSIASPLSGPADSDGGFGAYAYFSGTTFFTLGYGDVVPRDPWGKALSVTEAGIGFGFLALVISYLPVLYQAFSRREITISLLDARAGSPPSAGELLRRLAVAGQGASAGPLLMEWERWAAELLESHLSFPVLSYYRSQHENQSWVAALTTILDTCALLMASADGPDRHQARLTFAMARHAAVDLALLFGTPPQSPPDRLPDDQLALLRQALHATGPCPPGAAKALTELRALYEPFVQALSLHFLFPLPVFQPPKPPVDNWQTSAWTKRTPGLGELPGGSGDDHFD